MMRAARLTSDGPAIVQVPLPEIQTSELLVRVHASALNRADLLMIDGQSHGLHGGIGTALGLEWAGEVVALGTDAAAQSGLQVGDRVMCSGLGAFADYAVADWRRCQRIPEGMDDAQAACLSVALRTSYVAMCMHGQWQAGQTLLVQGATSGVGLLCLQLAKELGAGLVIGTSTSAAKRARLAAFGADHSLNTHDSDWADQVLALTAGRGVDLVVDFLAGPLINDSMRATALAGRIVNVGRMAGEQAQFDFDLHSLRRIQYLGTTFRTRTAHEMGEIGAAMRAALWPALCAGRLRLPIDCRMPLARLNEALALMRSNQHFGKIVLSHELQEVSA